MSGTNNNNNNNNDIIIDEATRLKTVKLAKEVARDRSNMNFFRKILNADLNRSDLSPDDKREHEEAWARMTDFMNESFTNGIPPHEEAWARVADFMNESFTNGIPPLEQQSALADIEKADKAVVGLTAAATTTATVLSTTATAMTTTTADQLAAVLLPNSSGSAGSVIPSSENGVDGDDDDDNNDYQASFAAIDRELHALKSRAATKMAQLKKDHKKKIKNVRSECDAIRSELKTKNNEAAVLQKQNAELRLEIDQKNQTIDALQAEVVLQATKTKGHDAIP